MLHQNRATRKAGTSFHDRYRSPAADAGSALRDLVAGLDRDSMHRDGLRPDRARLVARVQELDSPLEATR